MLGWTALLASVATATVTTVPITPTVPSARRSDASVAAASGPAPDWFHPLLSSTFATLAVEAPRSQAVQALLKAYFQPGPARPTLALVVSNVGDQRGTLLCHGR